MMQQLQQGIIEMLLQCLHECPQAGGVLYVQNAAADYSVNTATLHAG